MKILVYDLPSENNKVFSDEVKIAVRSVRILSTYYLHRLGVLTTESVILIPDSRCDLIDATIKKVRNSYDGLKDKYPDYSKYFNPILKVLDTTEQQKTELIDIAVIALKKALEGAIEKIELILQEETNPKKIKNIIYSLNRSYKEWIDIWEKAKNLGINLDHKFQELIDLINYTKEKILEEKGK